MKRTNLSDYSNIHSQSDITNQTAFHEAGHAASIYFGNKQKQLPPIFFQIQIKESKSQDHQLYAKVIDGCLIQNLPIAGLDDINLLSEEQKLSYQCAYEADVMNLLVGPLAEAKYVSIRDDEIINFNLLNTHALNYYGGTHDIDKAYAFLNYFISSEQLIEDKMLEIFSQAFQFIENRDNWKQINKLAQYILSSNNDIISCEEVIDVLNDI